MFLGGLILWFAVVYFVLVLLLCWVCFDFGYLVFSCHFDALLFVCVFLVLFVIACLRFFVVGL